MTSAPPPCRVEPAPGSPIRFATDIHTPGNDGMIAVIKPTNSSRLEREANVRRMFYLCFPPGYPCMMDRTEHTSLTFKGSDLGRLWVILRLSAILAGSHAINVTRWQSVNPGSRSHGRAPGAPLSDPLVRPRQELGRAEAAS
ncbi:hypothetical protein Bbelb_228480 [Branchiostoma belcheri]|nr:hypothetical protein Bbelb_228480 [Branchiostoma belcheri]